MTEPYPPSGGRYRPTEVEDALFDVAIEQRNAEWAHDPNPELDRQRDALEALAGLRPAPEHDTALAEAVGVFDPHERALADHLADEAALAGRVPFEEPGR